MILPIKRGTGLHTKLLKVMHMSKPIVFWFDLLKSILKLAFSNVCDLHMRQVMQVSGIDWRPRGDPFSGAIFFVCDFFGII